MAKKHKHHHHPILSSADLEARVRRAEQEGRFQQALELVKQLYKQEPTPGHKDLLKRVYLGRARQLRQQGYFRDGASVLTTALQVVSDDPAWVEQAAEELVACGEVRQALNLAERTPNSPARTRILAKGVDQALRQAAKGRELLPEALREPFDRVVKAFALVETGQDDQARELLQDIGLQSPFLEWKLLLRGLMAYFQGEDARALENWQRLNPERLPLRLVAPLRFGIDPAYRVAQDPQAQAVLLKQADRLQEVGPVQALRSIQAALATGEQLPQAFRLAEGIVASLRQINPHLVPRLANCFYWAIVNGGQPEDMTRYKRVFGEPPDDPGFARLQALVHEHMADFKEAHRQWQRVEQSVAHAPGAWPGDQATRVRSLIWCHMGRNAARLPAEEEMAKLPPFLRDHPDRPRPLVPNAEECFRRSIELAPDYLEPYEELFHYYQREKKKAKKAEQAARQLLERFPDHLPTLEALADLRVERQDYPEGLALYQRALKVNPLDRGLRSKLSTTHLFNARAHAEAGRFAEARAEYQTTLSLDNTGGSAVLCKWAACEFKAGDAARAEELLQQALAKAAGVRIAIAFSMLIETIRLKLPRTLKTRFDKEFNEALAEPPTAAGAVEIIDTAATHRSSGVTYIGQKTHEKKVLAYVEKARQGVALTENQLQRICAGLLELQSMKALRSFTALGQRQFPQNPHFPFLEAESYLQRETSRMQPWRVQPLLDEAARLARLAPQDERTKELLAKIQDRQEMLRALNPFVHMFNTFGGGGPFGGGPFGSEGGFFFEDDYDDDDDWDDEDDWEDDSGEPFYRPPKRKKRKRR